MGASAGGVEALKLLFSLTPPHPDVAFVVIVHLSPKHESRLAEVIGSSSALAVSQAGEGDRVEGAHVYVIPPNHYLRIEEGVLHLEDSVARPRVPKPIDHFMNSLAADTRFRPVGIILTGADHDGTAGLTRIKAAGGLTIAQDPRSAAHPGMPSSALLAGPDLVLPIERIPSALGEWVHHPLPDPLSDSEEGVVDAVLDALLAQTGQDFRDYRRPMLGRRLRRRAGLHRLDTLLEYLELVRSSPGEATALVGDLLIGVTEFFRDPDSWRVLEQEVIASLQPASGQGVRAWSVGCSTGEEAYSLAMLLLERFPDRHAVPVSVFASDIDAEALKFARAGTYPRAIAEHVSSERLERFFAPSDGRFAILDELRKSVVFSNHNLLSDPPFSRLDLIVCRNLLIYLEPSLQQRVLEIFHFALRQGGCLFLGKSESPGPASTLFEPVSSPWRIYRRRPSTARRPRPLPPHLEHMTTLATSRLGPGGGDPLPGAILQQALLEGHTPAAALVQGHDHRVLYLHGETRPFLAHPQGEPDLDLTRMVRTELRTRLRAALRLASREKRPARVSVRAPRGDAAVRVEMTVEPAGVPGHDGLLLVTFREEPDKRAAAESRQKGGVLDESTVLLQLEQELREARRDLQGTLEELESSRQEHTLTDEEALSINEELQSSNEELETSKEELLSLNEELTTVNRLLEDKVSDLERANDDLDNLFVSTHIPTLFLDQDLCIKRFTPAATGLFRLIPSDLQRPIQDITSRVDDSTLLEDVRAVLATLEDRQTTVSAEDGRYFLRHVVPYRTGQGSVQGVVVTFVDITATRKALEEHTRLAAVVRDSNDAIFLHGPEGRILSWNPAAERIYGYRAAEAIGMWMESIIPEESRTQDAETEKRVLLGEVVPPYDSRRLTRDGAVLDVSVTPSALRDEEGRIHALISTERDITLRKRLELSLRSESRFRSLVDDVPALIWMLDAKRRVVFVNRSCAEYTGVDPSDPGERAWPDRSVHPEDLGPVRAQWDLASDRHSRFEAECRLRGAAGSYRWTRIVGVPRTGVAGEYAGHIVLAMDQHERKLAEDALAAADRRKDEFLAMLAHELRNPLAPIRSAGELIGRDAPAGSRIARAAAILQSQTHQISRLVDDLLDVARISSGKVTVHRRPLDLLVAIRRAVETCGPLVESRRQRLEVVLSPEPLMVSGDLVRLAQVFGNLLNNAAKFTPEGGRIGVEARREGNKAVVEVTDSGAGIPPEMLDAVFDVFFQAPSTLGRSPGGLGLGLTLVRRLVELHGGRVEARSPGVGKGSTFVVEIPWASGVEARAVPGPDPRGRERDERLQVLVVDDNEDAANAMAMLLEMEGHDVRTAPDGASALDAVQRFHPHVVLLDIGLPDASGYDVARQIRGLAGGSDVRIIAVTGYGQSEDISRSRAAGFDHHVLKPVQQDVLEALLSDVKRGRNRS